MRRSNAYGRSRIRPRRSSPQNDNLAFRAIGMLHLAGFRVPQAVTLVGFDDIPLARKMVPPLPTVRIPLAEIGRRAARLLLDLIETGQPGSGGSNVIVPHLICRATA